jgi:hypothetical protein
VHFYSERRDSPVLLEGPMSQTVTLRIDAGEKTEVRVPDPVSVSNDLGSFRLEVERSGDGTLTLRRALAIGPEEDTGGEGAGGRKSSYGTGSYRGLLIGADDWPLLRQLLLEESDPRHRTILLE